MGISISWSADRTLRSSSGGDSLYEVEYQTSLDILVLEEISYSGDLTDKTIEGSAFVTDHYKRKPVTLRCECFHTNTPLTRKNSHYKTISRNIGKQSVLIGARDAAEYSDDGVASNPEKKDQRILDTLTILERLQETGTEVLLEGVRVLNKSWVITDLQVQRDPSTAGAAVISFVFKEVRKGFVSETESPQIERGRRRRQLPPARGQSSTTPDVDFNSQTVRTNIIEELELEETQTDVDTNNQGYSYDWDLIQPLY